MYKIKLSNEKDEDGNESVKLVIKSSYPNQREDITTLYEKLIRLRMGWDLEDNLRELVS